MKDLIVNVSRKTRMVSLPEEFISVDGENLQSNLVFRFTDEFVDGQARLEYKLGGTKNYIVLTENNEEYSTPVKNVITKEGRIEMQLVITEGTDPEEIPVFKSNVFYLYCNKSINAVNEAPEGYDLWIEVANEKLNEMDNIDIDIQTVGDNTEVIITRKDGTTKEAIVSGGGGVSDVQVNNVSVVSGGVANIDLTGKQDTLVSGTNIKTINGQDITGSGNITIESGTGDVADVYYDDESVLDSNNIAQLYSEIYVGDTAPDKSQKIWIDTSEDDVALKDLQDDTTHRLVTDTEKTTWSGKQDALVSGTNIKTINNQSLLGSGNITIQGGSGGTSDYDQLSNRPSINSVTLTGNKSLNDLGIQPAGSYLTSETDPVFSASASAGITSTDISNWNAKYSKPSGGIPDTDLSSAVQTSLGKADTALQSETYTGTITSVKMNGSTVASSGEADLGTVLTSHQNIKTINSTSLVGTGDVTVQETLVSGTNIKTINNQSILGSGNISISGGGGTATDVQVNGTSIVSNDVANLVTQGTYNASTNKLATMSDVPSAVQYSTMPTASSTNLGQIVQFIGTTDSNYKNGYFYECSNTGTSANPVYEWTIKTITSYDKLDDRPKINNIPISGNKTPQMYGIQPAGSYATDPTITSNQINATQTFTLNNNYEYRNTIDMTSITLNLPSTIDNNYCSWLVFPSGSTATSLTYPNTIIWSGDDVSNNAFVPVSDKTYNVCFWYDGINVNGVVRGA